MASIPVPQKNRGRPATGVTPRVGVRLAGELSEAIDRFASDEADHPTRSEAIRRLLIDQLTLLRYLPLPPEEPEGE